MSTWGKLLNQKRRALSNVAGARAEGRREFERDFDRILFSTPVRRMADKTQVFPLEPHDAVHTRLTHSHEVSALARSVGIDLVARYGPKVGLKRTLENVRDVSALMAAVGLVHDIGNPPFGHQGEKAIQSWLKAHSAQVFAGEQGADKELQQDFLRFEGNAQTFRLVARLQRHPAEVGLNLTFGTLAALLKYAVCASSADKDAGLAGRHKPGFFKSEEEIVADVWKATGLANEQRHPLVYLVEACDDTAYSAIDVEDTVRKDLASHADVCEFLRDGARKRRSSPEAKVVRAVIKNSKIGRARSLGSKGETSYSPSELDDSKMQVFRTVAISEMVKGALDAFVANFTSIMNGTFRGDLLGASKASLLRELLKDFLRKVAFPHRSVLSVELQGTLVIHELMDRLWRAITDREDRDKAWPARRAPLSAYTYSRISENYRRVFEQSGSTLPMWYREAQLVTDMVAGMTDSFALSLLEDLRRFDRQSR